jgi:hypothetical protein
MLCARPLLVAALLLSLITSAGGNLAELLNKKHRDRWGADLVVVVTWHRQPLDWLAVFPPNRTRFVLYIKGEHKWCEHDIPAAVRPSVVYCERLHNAGGREGHTIVHFVVTHYHSLPRLVFFLQDDLTLRHEIETWARMSDDQYAAWLDEAEAHPFSSTAMCLCHIALEPMWLPDLPDGTPRYAGYERLRDFMVLFLDHNVTAEWTAIRWATHAEFIVPGKLIRRRPRLLFQLILQLVNGTMPVSHDDWAPDTQLVYKGMQLLYLAHMFERLFFAIFDPDYQPNHEHYAYTSPSGRPALKQLR